jgi:hypothetical protein
MYGNSISRSHGRAGARASMPRGIVIPAASLAEFLAGAVASHGSIRRAADGIGVPYSTLRGWLRRRGGDAGDHREAFSNAVVALRGHLDSAKQHLTPLLGDIKAISERIDALEHMLGRESDVQRARASVTQGGTPRESRLG